MLVQLRVQGFRACGLWFEVDWMYRQLEDWMLRNFKLRRRESASLTNMEMTALSLA